MKAEKTVLFSLNSAKFHFHKNDDWDHESRIQGLGRSTPSAWPLNEKACIRAVGITNSAEVI